MTVKYYGSIAMLRPTTKAARRWIDEFLAVESWQWVRGAVAVEPRYVEAILDAYAEDSQ